MNVNHMMISEESTTNGNILILLTTPVLLQLNNSTPLRVPMPWSNNAISELE